MTQATCQKMFDIFAPALLAQNAPSIADLPGVGETCAYRGDLGRKCAVGHLIADEFYHDNLEGKGASELSILEAVEKSLDAKLDFEDQIFLVKAQKIHDQCNQQSWHRQLNTLALEHDLNPQSVGG